MINQKALANEKMLLAASEKGKSIEDDAKAARVELERLMERARKSEMLRWIIVCIANRELCIADKFTWPKDPDYMC